MASVLPFDELNRFNTQLRERFGTTKLVKDDSEDIIDMLLDLFLLAYSTGNNVTNMNLGSAWTPTLDDVTKTVNKKVAGKTWEDRAKEYFSNGGSVDDIVRIAETETHRIANTAALETAKKAGAKSKTWHCMMLPTSRDTHVYLDGVTVPIDGEFYSFKGGSTQFPGQWGIAEEDVNCLCWLSFEK